jgi:CheY-like chemotaxis protein
LSLDADAYVVGAAVAAAVLLVIVLVGRSSLGRREAEAREVRRRGEESAARRLKEFEDMRARLVALERHAEEMRQALAARAALDAAAPPPAAAAASVPPPVALASGADAAPRPRALVCVAEATAARVFESLLKARGFDVDRCGDGIDAAALAARRTPVLAVLDLDAAGDEPSAIAKAIRAHLAKDGRLFLLAPQGVDARKIAPGAEFLPKPVDFVAMARLIRGGAAKEVRR